MSLEDSPEFTPLSFPLDTGIVEDSELSYADYSVLRHLATAIEARRPHPLRRVSEFLGQLSAGMGIE